MALFENYEGRMPQIQPVLDKYGFKDFDEVKAYNNSKGVDANQALKDATGHYGRFDDAARYIDPRQE